MSSNSTQGPLAGIRVLDFTHVLAGPFATLLLADLGADVVKVEKPGCGDTTRGTPPSLHGLSHYFVAVNHSKRGIGIDLQHAQGRALLLRLAAVLYERERTGRGQVLDVSMFDCLFSFLSYYVTLPQATGTPPEPAGSMHASVVPMGAFRTQDGHIAVAAFNQRFWRGLCAAVDRPDLADDPRYASLRERQSHRDALMAELSVRFATHTSQHGSERLDAHDVPNGPVHDVLSLLEHPWVDERRLLRPVPTPDGGSVRVSRQPVVYGSAPPPVAPAAPAPELGQHTDTVLRQWLALPEADILALRQGGAIT